MKGLIRWVIILAILGGVGFLVTRVIQGSSEADKPIEAVEAASRRDIETNLLLTGEVTPAFKVEVKSEVSGKVKKIEVLTGDFVKKGEVLFVIDDTDLLTEKASAMTDIEGAQLSVDKNRGNYDRAKALFEQKLISKEVFANLEADLAIAENSWDKAKSRLQIVEDKLSKTRILAPSDGTVLDIPVNEGQVVVAAASVNSGTVLMTFADLSRLLIDSHVNQADAPRLVKDLPVEVNMPMTPESPVRAKIDTIAPLATVKNNIKGFKVEAVIEDNDGRLKPGMSVSMNVPVERVTDAVSVPVGAVFRERKENVVYVRKSGTTEKRKVVVGLTDMSHAEIKSGLQEGEEILLVEPAASPAKS